MFGLHFSRLGSVSRLGLVPKALAILRSYGADAHIYLPGVGTVNGITAGNYLDSAGTTAATVDNPVGLSLDALQAMTLGGELLSGNWQNGYTTSFDTFTSTSPTSFSGTNASTESVRVKAPASFVAGITYQVTLGGSLTNATIASSWVSNSVYGGVQDIGLTSIGQQVIFKAASTADSLMIIFAASSGAAVNAQVSVREITGIHATQATTANKPILRLNSGKYSWQFDQSNDFLQTSITTGDVGWLCAGVTFTDSDSTLFCSGAGSAAQKGIWTYRDAASDAFVTLIGNGTAPTSPASIAAPAGQPLVIASGWDASNIFHSVNSTETTASRTGSASPSPSTLRIGAYTDGITYALGGNLNIALAFDVLPTAAERLTLKRWVGQLSGVSL